MLEALNQKELQALQFLLEKTEKAETFTQSQVLCLLSESLEPKDFEEHYMSIYLALFDHRENETKTNNLAQKTGNSVIHEKEELIESQDSKVVSREQLQRAIKAEFLHTTPPQNPVQPLISTPFAELLLGSTPSAVGRPGKLSFHNCSRRNSLNLFEFPFQEDMNVNHMRYSFKEVGLINYYL